METIEKISLGETSNSQFKNSSESDILIYILKLVIKKWWIFLIIGLLGGVGGFIYASLQKPVYQSYLSFALDEGGSEGGASAAMGLASQLGISLGGSQDVFTGDNIIEIMLSRRIIEDVLLSVDTFNNKPMTLIEFYRQNELANGKNNKNNIHFNVNELRNSFSYTKDSILYNTFLKFKKDLVTARRPDKKVNIYELMVTSPNEKFSKVFTDKLIDKTNHFYTEIRSKKAKETLEILEERVPEMKSKFDASISGKAAIQDANLNTAFANALVPLLKEQNNSQVYGTAYAEMFKNLEIARFQYLKSIPLLQIIDAANYPMIKIKAGKIKSAIIFAVVPTFIFLMIFIIINIFRYKKANPAFRNC
ncbi:MAG: Wzz/FepE/Etk N-terminal domain-containing protein [Ginsengibacter sp.]